MKWSQNAPCTLEAIKTLRLNALNTLRAWGIENEDEIFDLEVILCELLSNAAKHGNQWEENKKVKVNMRYLYPIRTVILLVCDQGGGQITLQEPEVMSEGGKGLFLVESLGTKLTIGRGRVWVRKELMDEENISS
jgi:anti-sigma regulatory factor (Ser/Thr protein kinase)